MKIFYSDTFVLPLPTGHRFPMAKYARLRRRVEEGDWAPPHRLRVPDAVTDRELLRAHAPEYVERVETGDLDRSDVRRIGFPWSPELVERSRRSVGGTVAAARAALTDGWAVNLAGGTHHASRSAGGGFCVFNDVAVAARAVQAEGRARRVAVLDLDVHQGDGTAAIFADDPTVFTLSIHGANNYPFTKLDGDLDLALPDGTTDEAYLEAVSRGVAAALDRSGADLALYVAGADPWEGDALGRLAVSRDGMARRDRIVMRACQARGVPVAVVMSGGYAPAIDDTVALHLNTVREAARRHRASRPTPVAP